MTKIKATDLTAVAKAIETWLAGVAMGKAPAPLALASLIGFKPVSADIVDAALAKVREGGAEIKGASETAIKIGLILADRVQDIRAAAAEICKKQNNSNPTVVGNRIGKAMLENSELTLAEAAKVALGKVEKKTDDQKARAAFISTLKRVIRDGEQFPGKNAAVAAFTSQAQKLYDALNA